MALEILKVIKQGDSTGYQTIMKEILKMESFMDKKDTDFKETFDELEKIECVLPFRDEAKNNARCFMLNSDKDCIQLYKNKLDAVAAKDGTSAEKENLETESLRKNIELITTQLSDYDKVKSRSVRSDRVAIIAIILTVIGLVLQWILRKTG